MLVALNVVNRSVSEGEVVKNKEHVREVKSKKLFVLLRGDARVKLDWIIYPVPVRQCSNHGPHGHNVPNLVKLENKCVGENVSQHVVRVN